MARGTTFLALVDMLKDEIGRSTNASIGIDDIDQLKRHINRSYALAYDDGEWPHLRTVVPRITLNASQRLYDFPVTVDYERVESITAWMGAAHYPLERGITAREYAIFDSEAGTVTSDPAQRFDLRWSGSAPQIEIWPMPASSTQTLEVIGTRKVSRLVNDADLCLLDDELVVLGAAIRLLSRQKSEDAQIAAAELRTRMAQMKKRSSPPSRVIMGGGGTPKFTGIHLSVTGR